jgi:hypothetical protein
MKTIKVILERGSGDLWGRVEESDFSFFTTGNTVDEIINNLKELVSDFIENEGADNPNWNKVSIDNLTFEVEYDLTDFFELYSSLKISTIAKYAGINESLMRQYASGIKYPSTQQVKKIEDVIHQLANNLLNARLA